MTFDMTITDQDIQWIKEVMPDIEFDETRIEILKNMANIDIHACPGSGKTTLLVAKLAIIANKWKDENKGICVLSHTNVAREEIQYRLGKLEVGKKLLSYPHFVGTFQSFFDIFISMPYLRSNDFPVNVVDTDFVTSRRWDKLYSKQWFEKNNKDKMVFDPLELPYEFDVKCDPNTKTYRSLIIVTKDSREKGEFTFKEMELYALEAIKKYPIISRIFQNRFPIMLIDEAQDTKKEIWNLINALYINAPSNVFYQAFGDSNQAIFDSYKYNGENKFPREKNLKMLNSKRFDNSIAKLANGVALDGSCMIGEETKFSNRSPNHTIFLFEKGQEELVLQKYSDLILNTFSDEELHANERYGCYVLGMIHKSADNNNGVAERISDYYPDYNPDVKKNMPTHLIDYFYIANEKFLLSGEFSDKINWICKGLLKLLKIAPAKKIFFSNTAFNTIIENTTNNNIRKDLLNLCEMKYYTERDWGKILEKVYTIFNDLLDIEVVKKHNYIVWKNETNICENDFSNMANKKIFYDSHKERKVELNFGSIHSSKGRTYLSTLVVETKYYEYNMKSIINWLAGEKGKIGGRNTKRLKCQYVAMTRAKGLVCLALLASTITPDEMDMLNEYGWKIEKL